MFALGEPSACGSMWARHLAGALIVCLLLARPGLACLWDTDTLRQQAERFPGLAEIITGRFERNPPLYYEMRLARCAAQLENDSSLLEAYDDCGVACDRLGRGDDAIAWMARKRTRLDASIGLDPAIRKEHEYRYHANLGTILAHRWFRSGSDRANMSDLRSGCDEIKKAIEINPDAHFGREKYQLMAMEWVLNPPKSSENGDKPSVCSTIFDAGQEHYFGYDEGMRVAKELPDATKGLAGLIVLGNAWESVDVFVALKVALDAEQQSQMSYLTECRISELVEAGRRSSHPDARSGGEFMASVPQGFWKPEKHAKWEISGFYERARKAADKWAERREAFMLERLKAGRHPDTDAAFWDGYREDPPPTPPGGWISQLANLTPFGLWVFVPIGVITLPIVIALARFIRRWVRRRSTHAA